MLAEHCLRPVWLSAFARMCGGTSEADDALWAEVDELSAQKGGEAAEATAARLIERLSLFGAPWLAHGELPAPSRGGLWLNVPSTSATGEDEDAGFAAETAALRAAYALARIATGGTVAALVRVLSEGAAAALQSGDGRVVGAFNASYALQSLALLRPALAQTSGLCDALLASLGRAMVGEVTVPAICLGNCKMVMLSRFARFRLANPKSITMADAIYLLGYWCVGQLSVAHNEAAVASATEVVSKLTEVAMGLGGGSAPPVEAARLACLQPAAVESLGIVAAALRNAAGRADSALWAPLTVHLRQQLHAAFRTADDHVRDPAAKVLDEGTTAEDRCLLEDLKWLKAAQATDPSLNLDAAPGRVREGLGMALLKLGDDAPPPLGATGLEPRAKLVHTPLAYFTSYGSSATFPYRIV